MKNASTQRAASKAGAAWLLAIGSIVAPAIAQASDYQVISETSVSDGLYGNLVLTETVVQDGPDAINRFTMHRLRRPDMQHRGALLLLPSLGNSFAMYLVNEDGDINKSFAVLYASQGYDVWGYSPRTTGIGAGECGVSLDCSAALNWSLQTMVDDVTYIRSQIQADCPDKETVVGGLSLGAIMAQAVVNQYPNDYAGLLAWDGSLVTDDPTIQAHNQVFCDMFTGLVAAGIPVDDQSLPFVKLVTQLAQIAPNDPFAIPIPGFPPGLTNHQAFVFILSTPNPFAPSARPGFIAASGDVALDKFCFSDETRLMANIAVFDEVTANRVSQDLYCGLAGADTTYTANLGSFTGPALIISAGRGFGSIMDELAEALGSTSVETISNESFGHVDHFGTPDHWLTLELPILLWLTTEVFH